MDVLQSYYITFFIFPQILFIDDAQISPGNAQSLRTPQINTFFFINLNKYPHVSTTEAKIVIGRLICTSND